MENEEQEDSTDSKILKNDEASLSLEQDIKGDNEDNNDTEFKNGPFKAHALIQSLPAELEYTYFEAYDQNIYLGTSTGDLLHYFEIEPRNYMLVSQTKFDADSTHAIDSILLLPKIERALVLSNRTLVVFLLPEFAPAPNTVRIKGVTDVTLKDFSDHSKCYKVYAAQDDKVKLVKVGQNGVLLSNTYDLKNIKKLRAHGHILAVAEANSYEIIDLKTSRSTPLFRVSEADAPLVPVITDLDQHEFLITTGGASYNDSSMALVVNHNGDVVNGTIVLESYPSAIIVSFPYIIVNFRGKSVCVYRMGDDPQIVQRIESKTPNLNISRTTKVFDKFKNVELKQKTVDKLRKVSIFKDSNQTKIENERDYINEIFEEESSLAIYGKSGIYVLLKSSPILEFTQFDEKNVSEIKDFIHRTETNHITKFVRLEVGYLSILMLLIICLHCKTIDVSVTQEWCSYGRYVDIRLFFYVLELEIFGDLWIPNGLVRAVEEVRSLKLLNKCSRPVSIFKEIKPVIKKFQLSNRDFENITKTVDVNIFKQELYENEGPIDVSVFDDVSLVEITNIIQDEPDKYTDVLLQLYKRRGMLRQCLDLMRTSQSFERMLLFLKENVGDLPSSYVAESLTDDLALIIKSSSERIGNIIEEAMVVLSKVEASPRDLIAKAGENANIKAAIIENLGAQDPDDKQYLAEYYVLHLQKTMEENKLWDVVAQFMTEYSHDMNYTKCCVSDFLSIKILHHNSFKEFSLLFDNITQLLNSTHEKHLLKNIIDQVEEFDISKLLALLFLGKIEFLAEILGKKDFFEVYLTYNDFISIEECLDQDNIFQVLSHYAEFPRKESRAPLISSLLMRNQKLIQDEDILTSVLKQLPTNQYFGTLFDPIFCFIRKIDAQQRDQEIHKALLKSEIRECTDLLNLFEQDKPSNV